MLHDMTSVFLFFVYDHAGSKDCGRFRDAVSSAEAALKQRPNIINEAEIIEFETLDSFKEALSKPSASKLARFAELIPTSHKTSPLVFEKKGENQLDYIGGYTNFHTKLSMDVGGNILSTSGEFRLDEWKAGTYLFTVITVIYTLLVFFLQAPVGWRWGVSQPLTILSAITIQSIFNA